VRIVLLLETIYSKIPRLHEPSMPSQLPLFRHVLVSLPVSAYPLLHDILQISSSEGPKKQLMLPLSILASGEQGTM